jgi:glutathione peroxidase-family protein
MHGERTTKRSEEEVSCREKDTKMIIVVNVSSSFLFAPLSSYVRLVFLCDKFTINVT